MPGENWIMPGVSRYPNTPRIWKVKLLLQTCKLGAKCGSEIMQKMVVMKKGGTKAKVNNEEQIGY